MRKYEVVHLADNGDIHDISRLAPATARFEEAFSAFARGTLIATVNGPVAIEDLLPGDLIKCSDGDAQPLLWRGSMALVPHMRESRALPAKLTRISTDSFGLGRPVPDLLLGPRGRLLHRSPALRRLTGTDAALVSALDYIDGVNIIEITPVAPVQVFHLMLEQQAVIFANGVETASHHPGAPRDLGFSPSLAELYLSLFPSIDSFEGFGPEVLPQLPIHSLDLIEAA